MAAGSHSTWTRVGTHQVHARVWPAVPGAPVLVLVHGFLVSSRYMIPLGNELARRFNVRAIDLPGHGRSSKPDRTLEVHELGAVLNDWIDANRLHDVTVVANSFGCQVTTEALHMAESSIERAIFIGPTVDSSSSGVLRQVLMMAVCIPFEPWWFVPVSLRDLLDCGPRHAIETIRKLSRHSMFERIRAVDVPVHLLRGRWDFVANQAWLARLCEVTPALEVTTIEDAGHIAHGKRPAEVARLITETIGPSRLQMRRELSELRHAP